MTTFMQEIIDLSDVPRRTDVPVCTNMTRWMFIVFPRFIWIDTVVLILGDCYDTGVRWSENLIESLHETVRIWNLKMCVCTDVFGQTGIPFRPFVVSKFWSQVTPCDTLFFSFSAVFLSNIYEEVKAGNNKINIAMDWLEFQGGLFCSKFVLKRLWQIKPKFLHFVR